MALTPFDGLSAELGEPIKVLTDAGLETRGLHIRETGEDITGTRVYAHDLNLTYTIIGEKIFLNGSGHKYSNGGEHNYNDFLRPNLANFLKRLYKDRGINPTRALLHNIEFGVNIIIQTNVSEVLKSLLTYKGKPFEKFTTKGDGYQCRTGEFIIKIYNKGKQYNRPENIIRIEIKVTRMRFLKSKGIDIVYMSDMLKLENYPSLAKMISTYFKEILFLNRELDIQSLSDKDRELYLKGSNKSYWERPDKSKAANQTDYARECKKQIREEDRFRHMNRSDAIQDLSDRLDRKLQHLGTYSELELSENHRGAKRRIVRKSHFIYRHTFRQRAAGRKSKQRNKKSLRK